MFSYIDLIKISLQICTCQANEEPSKYICLNIWFCFVHHHYQHILWVILSLSNFFTSYFLNLSSIPFFYNLVTTRVNGEGIPDIIGNFPMNSPGSWIGILSYWHLRKSRQWYCVVLRQLLNPLVPRVAYLLHKPLRSTNSKINVCFVFFPSVECLLQCKVIIRYRNIVIITFCGYLLFSRKCQPP